MTHECENCQDSFLHDLAVAGHTDFLVETVAPAMAPTEASFQVTLRIVPDIYAMESLARQYMTVMDTGFSPATEQEIVAAFDACHTLITHATRTLRDVLMDIPKHLREGEYGDVDDLPLLIEVEINE